jgi:hypothetical protein
VEYQRLAYDDPIARIDMSYAPKLLFVATTALSFGQRCECKQCLEISALRVFRRLLDKPKEPSPMAVPGLREPSTSSPWSWNRRQPSREKMRWRAGWQSGCFDCRLPNVCHLPFAIRARRARSRNEKRRQVKKRALLSSCLIHPSEPLQQPMRSGAWPH